MKKFIKEHKKELAISAGIATVGLVFVLGVIVGQAKGEADLVEALIHNERYDDNNWPVYTSLDKRLGGLLFKIKAECIGD